MTHLEQCSKDRGPLLYVLLTLHFKVSLSLLLFEPGRLDAPMTLPFSRHPHHAIRVQMELNAEWAFALSAGFWTSASGFESTLSTLSGLRKL